MQRRIHARLPIPLAVAALAVTVVFPLTARAFFQSTKVVGVVGADVSGIWLAVYHTMPTFRVRLDTVEKTIAPFEVGPISKDVAPLFYGSPKGVQITKFEDPRISRTYGIFEGDVITNLNATEISSVEDFQKALKDVSAKWFLITVQRPRLSRSRVHAVKIAYDVSETTGEESSEIGAERVHFTILDGALPFAGAIAEAEKKHELFEPRKEHVDALREQWYRLPQPEKPVFVRGAHRIVGSDEYDASLRGDPNTRGALFAITSTLDGNPILGGGKTVAVYGVRKVTPDRIEGSYVESTLANAPFPISIEFSGTFRMVKLEPYSDKDVEYRAEQERKKEQAEQQAVELAPDITPEMLGDDE